MKPRRIVSILVLTLLAVTGCRTSPAVSEPTVDAEAVAHQAVEKLQIELTQQAPTPAPTLDIKQVAQAALAQLESQQRLQTPTPLPTLDVDQVAGTVLALIQAQTTPAPANGLETILTDLYRRANPAVVFIVVPFVGSGSGFVYSDAGHIVTNNHVVDQGATFEIVFATGERRRATLIGSDVDSDLAVLQVDPMPDGVEPLTLAETDDLQVGQFVIAIGNPFGEQGSMSLGIVSGLGRSLPSQREDLPGTRYSLPQVIQTDAPINPGNSGGPLLNLDGEVVGINAAIATLTGTNSGVGFSIPVAAMRQIVPSLIEKGAYDYPYMGAAFDEEITLDEQTALDLPQTTGAYVVSVTQGSPAEAAGLIAADRSTRRGGDLIIKLDDQTVTNFADLNSYLVFHTRVGQTIQVTVLRDGEPLVLSLTLGARP